MAYDHIVVEQVERITTIRINRPEVMNAIHPDASKELDDAFNKFAEDEEQWIAILTGTGDKAFCAGNDLKWQAQHGMDELIQAMQEIKGGFGGLHLRTDLNKPLIGAANGLALGGGLELLLCCDIIIASGNASFGFPEPTVGLIAGAGGLLRLPRQIGYRHAMGMFLTCKRISAQEALDVGLINQIVSADELLDTAAQWAAEMLKCAPIALRASKETVRKGLDMPLEKALGEIFPEAMKLYGSEDLIEGPKAFAEKRSPVWKGR